MLLRHEADPFLVDRAQLRTAIHYAASFGHAAALRLLLADSTRVDTEQGRMPLRLAKVCDMSGACRCAQLSHQTVDLEQHSLILEEASQVFNLCSSEVPDCSCIPSGRLTCYTLSNCNPALWASADCGTAAQLRGHAVRERPHRAASGGHERHPGLRAGPPGRRCLPHGALLRPCSLTCH